MKKMGMQRSPLSGIMVKVGFPLLIGLITLFVAHLAGMRVPDSLALTAVVAFGAALALFIVDTEMQISAVGERMTAGFAEIARLAQMSGLMERSSLRPALLADFLETASQVDERVDPLLQRLARREVDRIALFMRQLPVGAEIAYDGEDRDWLLGLTRESQNSIDAISLSTVDAGVIGLDGGLWTSDLGRRYIDCQHEAVARKVCIRRIFVVEQEHKEMVQDESFLGITQIQREIGVQVRMLDHQLIPDFMRTNIFDFIVFDGAVSYETTPERLGKLRTRLGQEPTRVRELKALFEKLWEQADPERQIDELSGETD